MKSVKSRRIGENSLENVRSEDISEFEEKMARAAGRKQQNSCGSRTKHVVTLDVGQQRTQNTGEHGFASPEMERSE